MNHSQKYSQSRSCYRATNLPVQLHTCVRLACFQLLGGRAEVSSLVASAHNSPGGCCLKVPMQRGVARLQWTTKWCSQECGKALKATRNRSATSLCQSTHPLPALLLHTHPSWESHMSYRSRTCWIIEADRTCPKPQSLSFSLTNTQLYTWLQSVTEF